MKVDAVFLMSYSLQIKIKDLDNPRLDISLKINFEIIPFAVVHVKITVVFHMGHEVEAVVLWAVGDVSYNLVFELVHVSLDVVSAHVYNFKVFGFVYENDLFEIYRNINFCQFV